MRSQIFLVDVFVLFLALFSVRGNRIENGTVHFNEQVYATEESVEFRVTAGITEASVNDSVTVTVYFGDGESCESSNKTASDMRNLDSTCMCNHSYESQGNFSVYASLEYNGHTYNTSSQIIYIRNVVQTDSFEGNRIENGTVHFNEQVYATGENAEFRVTANITEANVNDSITVTVYFGDGESCESSNKTASDMRNLNSTCLCNHSYKSQGNFSVYAYLEYIGHVYNTSSQTIYIWDPINVEIDSEDIAGVGVMIQFNLVPVPSWNIYYIIDFGDNENLTYQSKSFQESYITSPIKHAYAVPGIYNITLTAWNTIYSKFHCKIIRIEYPIPEKSLSISPESENIAFPPGETELTLTYSDNQDPTNVRCVFHYGDDDVEMHPVNLTKAYPIQKVHFYQSLGTKNVNFTCTNDLTVQSVFAVITVMTYTLDEFKFIYSRNPIPMSMTLTPVEPTDNYRHFYRSISVPVQVSFTISLRKFRRFPRGINVVWDFKDGTIEVFTLKSKTITHTFSSKRKTYHMVIKMESSFDNHTFNRPITLGVIDFRCSPPKFDLLRQKVICEATEITGTPTYSFQADTAFSSTEMDHFPVSDNMNGSRYTVTYQKYGFYIPYVQYSGSGEKVYLEQPLIADYSLNDALFLDIQPKQVSRPPWTVEFRVRSRSGDARPYTFCSMKLGDAVDRKFVYNETQNITNTQPIVFSYTYTSLGTHAVDITCSNYISEKTMTDKVIVQNSCFDTNGIFDRHYSIPTHPMGACSSEDLYITNRMNILCENENPNFQWQIFGADSTGKTNISILYENPRTEGKGTFLIKRNTLPEGVFYVMLNVSLSTTWISEYTYLRFFRSLPYAYIVGGDYVIGPKDLLFDALSESHIANGEFGDNKNLTFSWSCKRIHQTKFKEQEIVLDETPTGVCHVAELRPGIGRLIYSISNSSQYAVTVAVSEGPSQKNFTQIVTINDGPAKLQINCSLNCGNKIAVTSKLALLAWCGFCQPEQNVSYFWQLWKDESETGRFQPWQTFSGTEQQSLVLPKLFLTPGSRYLATVSITVGNNTEPKGKVYRKLNTNTPPVGGSCSITKRTDTSFVLISVRCLNWTDPDGDTEAFVYLYETVTRRSLSHGQEDIVSFLYEGSESSILDAPIQAGDPVYNHVVTVRVRVFDIYGDYGNFSSEITVQPPHQPTSVNDESTIESSFSTFDTKFNHYNLSGNEMRTLSLIGAVASGFKLFPHKDKTTTEEEVEAGVESVIIDSSGGGPVFLNYQQKVVKLLELVKEIITPGCENSHDRFRLADLQQALSVLDALLRYQPFIRLDAVNIACDIMATLVDCLEYGSRGRPLSTRSVDSITAISHVFHRVMDNVLNKMLPQTLQDFSGDAELLEEDIKAEIITRIRRYLQETNLLRQSHGNVTLDYRLINTQTSQLYKIRSHWRKEQVQQRAIAKEYIPIVKRTLSVFINVLKKIIVVGEKITLSRLNVLEIMIRKISFDDVPQMTDDFFSDVHKRNGSDGSDPFIAIAVSNFHKNPYIYGENASMVTSAVPVVEIPDHLWVDSKVPNVGNPQFKKYIPLINPRYSEQMIYFTFDVINDGDAGLIYLKPDGMDFSGDNVLLYSFYFSFATFPTSDVYDYKKVLNVRDWTKYGFKVFLQGGVCGKGLCYLGIKPLKVPDHDDFSGSRRKRAADPLTTAGPLENTSGFGNASEFVPVEANFSIIFTTTGCRTWDNNNNSWSMDGCQVLPMSDLNDTVCRCVGDTFSSSFYVPPNVINFLTVWGKFDASNASVYGTLIAVFVLFIILVIILRRQDKKDVDRWAVAFLSDHHKAHVYFYLITVYTGLRRGAGTKSNVYFVLTGDYIDTGIRVLSDGIKEGFSTSSVNSFFFGTTEPLGELKYIRVWHDNSGPAGLKSWFLNKITVDDLQTKERYPFHCNKWLAVDQDDCMLDRIIPVTAPDTVSFNTRLSDETQTQVTEHHMWLSLLMRPQQSKFTRVQRLSCLLALLCLIMISNAMFFQSSDETENVDQVTLGIFRFSFASFYVSCIGILISTPPIIFAAFVFRHVNSSKSAAYNISNAKYTAKKDYKQPIGSFSHVDGEVFNAKRDKLPHWVYYLAWVVVGLAIVSSSFFLVLYSMEWGKAKSEEWLMSFGFSFLESIVVVDPVKVIFLAMILTTILKNVMQEDTPTVDLTKLRSMAVKSSMNQETKLSDLTNYVLPQHDIFSKEEINELRKKCREESQARAALKNLILFIIYIISIYGISFMQRDQRSFHMKQNLDSYLLSANKGFSTLKGRNDFFGWMKETFIPIYYPNESYANEPLSVVDRQWFKDMASIRVGPARLRQVRMKYGTCIYTNIAWAYPCVNIYSEMDEDQSSYCLRWNPYNDTICGSDGYKSRYYTADAWKYTDASDIWGISRMGEYRTYSGGGYILKFVKNRENAYLLLDELVQNDWINRNTRAVFLEFTTYNPNVNLFVYAMFLVEFSEIGSSFTWTDTQAFKPVLSLSSLSFSLVVYYMIFLFYYIFLLFKILWRFKEEGFLRYVKKPWNAVDCMCTLLAWSCIVTFILRMKYTNTAMDMFYEDKLSGANRFINYGHIVIWDNAFNVLFAIVLFVSTIQILKILGYNKRFTEIIAVLTNAGRDLVTFGIVLLISFFAFALCAYLLFGSKLEAYKSVFETCGSLANTFIGRNKLDPMVVASPLAAQFFYTSYVLFVIMIMLTIFMSILNTSIAAVRAETAEAAAATGMVEIVKKSFQNFLNFFYKPKNRETEEKCVHRTNEQINAANVMGLIRDIVNVYGNTGAKHVKQKYTKDEDQHSLLLIDTPIPSFKLDPPTDDVFIEKYLGEDHHELLGGNFVSHETFHSVSRLSTTSASNVDLYM